MENSGYWKGGRVLAGGSLRRLDVAVEQGRVVSLSEAYCNCLLYTSDAADE